MWAGSRVSFALEAGIPRDATANLEPGFTCLWLVGNKGIEFPQNLFPDFFTIPTRFRVGGLGFEAFGIWGCGEPINMRQNKLMQPMRFMPHLPAH